MLETINGGKQTELDRLYKLYMEEEGFPTFFCERVTRIVTANTKLSRFEGNFLLDQESKVHGGKRAYHWWNGDSEAIYDLTLKQFARWVNIQIPSGVLVITRDNPLYSRYSGNLV